MQIERCLEINRIKEKGLEFCTTEAAKRRLLEMKPMLAEVDVKSALKETTEAKKIIEEYGNPPFTEVETMSEYLTIADQGGCLLPEQLEQVGGILACVKRLKDYLERAQALPLSLPYYSQNLDSCEEVREEILRVIRGNRVDDFASRQLRELRMEIERLEGKMREKAESILRNQKACMSEQFITIRNGHICVPVKKDCRSKVEGTVLDKSATGSTFFMEPIAVSRMNEELALVKLEEENEERRILYTLTAMLSDSAEIFAENKRVMEKLDFIFAKGRLSLAYDGVEPQITMDRRLYLKNARHPLMEKEIAVPLCCEMGNGVQGIIITGPNTGGKTVSIKTVGINSYLAQCGLHVAAQEATICLFNEILCDIGDGQDMEQNLSTFSAHITSVLEILRTANHDSLVILDELGSGTDPTEGMGIAIAILEQLREAGAMFLVTTHYPEVKTYGEETEGIVNARMAFDRDSLRPLYRLEVGKSGESCAFYIAKRLGMPEKMLRCATKAAYGIINEELLQGASDEQLSESGRHRKLQKQKKITNHQEKAMTFHRGDSVMVLPDKKIGIVCQESNEKGVLQVQLQGRKIWINYKRVQLIVAADQLYPEDYDFSIIFDSVEVRKARHQMNRKYAPEIELHYEEEK